MPVQVETDERITASGPSRQQGAAAGFQLGAGREVVAGQAPIGPDHALLSEAEFEDAVAKLVRIGYGRECARYVMAVRMGLPDHEVARLREAAR
jgi:hypothetical protein